MEKSFVSAGKSMAGEMRHRISMCSSALELRSAFSEISGRMIENVIGEGIAVMPLRGIIFDTSAKNHFRISQDLDTQPLFREAWYRSDLPIIIGHFAETAWHRYLHLQKDHSKRNLMIRN